MKSSLLPARPFRHRFAWILSLLLFCFTASAADNSAELQNLYNALNMLTQEQQVIYQQFQMVQAMMRKTPQMPYAGQGRQVQQMGEFPNYFDVIEERKNVDRREEDLYRQSEELIAKYNQIEEQKKPLQERIYSLTLSK